MLLLPTQLENLSEFELGLDPRRPEQGRMPVRILGYGEISTVFGIQGQGLEGLALKRLPLFLSEAEVDRYRTTFVEYNRLLVEEIGLHLPPHGEILLSRRNGMPVFYIFQPELPSSAIAHRALHLLSPDAVLVLVRRVLEELAKVWQFNQRQSRRQVGIDGQLSNWAIQNFNPENPHVTDAPLLYFDTSTPLFRVDGQEQLDTELFLRSAPPFLVWILRLLFLKDVVNRYYDLHLVAVDLAANLYKEQKAELIPAVVDVVNAFFAGPAADLGIKPIGEKEVRDYYREDALIWSLFLAMRKFDRFLRTRVAGQEYPYILPERIRR